MGGGEGEGTFSFSCFLMRVNTKGKTELLEKYFSFKKQVRSPRCTTLKYTDKNFFEDLHCKNFSIATGNDKFETYPVYEYLLFDLLYDSFTTGCRERDKINTTFTCFS